MLTAKENTTNIPPLATGLYHGVCSQIIDMGEQENKQFGGWSRKVRIVWDIPSEVVKIGDDEQVRRIAKEYTNSLSDKSNLRKMLQAWRGRPFSAEELKGFDLTKVLGVGAQLQIIHKPSKTTGEVYANIETVIPLPKGTKMPAALTTVFDLDDPGTYSVFNTLPRSVQMRISNATGFDDTGLIVSPKEGAASMGRPHTSATEFTVIEDGECEDLPF